MSRCRQIMLLSADEGTWIETQFHSLQWRETVLCWHIKRGDITETVKCFMSSPWYHPHGLQSGEERYHLRPTLTCESGSTVISCWEGENRTTLLTLSTDCYIQLFHLYKRNGYREERQRDIETGRQRAVRQASEEERMRNSPNWRIAWRALAEALRAASWDTDTAWDNV